MKHDSETTDKRTDRPKVSPYSKESKRDREEEGRRKEQTAEEKRKIATEVRYR